MLNEFMKKMTGPDARSARGRLARGNNVYGAVGSNSPNVGNLQEVARKRLEEMNRLR